MIGAAAMSTYNYALVVRRAMLSDFDFDSVVARIKYVCSSVNSPVTSGRYCESPSISCFLFRSQGDAFRLLADVYGLTFDGVSHSRYVPFSDSSSVQVLPASDVYSLFGLEV